jgi:hypothetical protein
MATFYQTPSGDVNNGVTGTLSLSVSTNLASYEGISPDIFDSDITSLSTTVLDTNIVFIIPKPTINVSGIIIVNILEYYQNLVAYPLTGQRWPFRILG